MKTIHIEFSEERLITPSGLVFVGQILGKSDFVGSPENIGDDPRRSQ